MRETTVKQLHRRACAAHRLEGGDPWRREYEDLPLTPHRVTAWACAAQQLLGDGLTPIVPADVLREMWRAGGEERALAERVRRSGGITAA